MIGSLKKVAVVGIPNKWSSRALVESLEAKTGFGLLIDINKVRLDLSRQAVFYENYNLSELDGIIIKKISEVYSPDVLDRLEILRYLAEKGVKIFSHPSKILRMLDRLSCTVTLGIADIPMPPTVITENIDEAVKAVREFNQAVIKPLYSTRARGIKILKYGKELHRELEAFVAEGHKVMYLQRKMDLTGKDMGIVFMGGKYLATYARVIEKKDTVNIVSPVEMYEKCNPSQALIDLAWKAQDQFKLDFACVDVAETNEGPVIFEVSAFGGFQGLKDACGIDAPDVYSDFIINLLENNTLT